MIIMDRFRLLNYTLPEFVESWNVKHAVNLVINISVGTEMYDY
jgi:hypothetical protein